MCGHVVYGTLLLTGIAEYGAGSITCKERIFDHFKESIEKIIPLGIRVATDLHKKWMS